MPPKLIKRKLAIFRYLADNFKGDWPETLAHCTMTNKTFNVLPAIQ